MKHHPSNEVLKKYAEAELNESLSSVVSAHIEQCSMCRSSVNSIEKFLATDLYSKTSPSQESLDSIWSNITGKLDAKPRQEKSSDLSKPTHITVGDQTFEMPRSLRNINLPDMKWMSFGREGKIARLKGDESSSLLLIYLGPNEEVPLHSHSGAEYSYVISGSFAASGTVFETGDFAFSDNTDVHTPKATSPDGCLLVSNVEERLNFFQGLLKPLNWIFWKFLNWKFNRL